eukprot:327239_1
MKLCNIKDDRDAYMHFCYGIIDVHHTQKKHRDGNPNKKKTKSKSMSKQNKPRKQPRNSSNRTQGRSKAFFDNCKILKPDGNILSCCSTKAMKWYLRKGLAEIMDAKTIKLTFEPKIRGLSFDSYHQATKESQCFVCGKPNDLCKFDVVPECYRQFIDSKYNNKAWRIHDHNPLCVPCHKRAMCAQNAVRTELCSKYNVTHYRVEKENTEYLRSKAKKQLG